MKINWGKIAFGLSLVGSTVMILNYIENRKIRKMEAELTAYNLQKARRENGVAA